MTVRVFVATSPDGDDLPSERVLEYTLKKHCSEPIEVVFMRNNDDPNNFFGGFDNTRWATPFTNLRWAIPEYCNFEGRAIYMDVDQVNFRDISHLFNENMEGAPLMCREGWRTCVTLMDCEKLKEHLPSVSELKKDPMFNNREARRLASLAKPIDPRWNCLDGEDLPPNEIWHLHWTHMPTQPWKPAWAAKHYAEQGIPFTTADHPRADLVTIWNRIRKMAEIELGIRNPEDSDHVAITTFPTDKWAEYGANIIPSFDKYWPKNVDLICYAENGTDLPVETSDRIKVLSLEEELPEVAAFQERNSHRREDVTDLSVVGKNFRFQTAKFSRKAYAILKELTNPRARYVWFLDADVETLQDVAYEFLDGIVDNGMYLAALPRQGFQGIHHTEVGFVVWDTQSHAHQDWLREYRKCWDDDYIFELHEWHDAIAWDYATSSLKGRIGIVDLGGGVSQQSSHPLNDGPLGEVFNHKKGPRKS